MMISRTKKSIDFIRNFKIQTKHFAQIKNSPLITKQSILPLNFSTNNHLLNVSTRYNFCQKKNGQNITQEFKDESKQFYQNQVESIIQLQNTEHWQSIISQVRDPIIIDIYADWCGPCKKLTPKLEKKVRQLQEQKKNVKLLKINIDKCPQMATALQVKSVPTVYLIYLGQAIDGFQGDVPDQQLDKFFQTINKISQSSFAQKEGVMALQTAKELIQQGKYDQAVQILEGFKEKQNRQDLVAIKQIFLTQCYSALEKFAKFKESLAKATLYQSFYRQNPDMHQFFMLMKQKLEALQSQQSEDPQLRPIKEQLLKYEDNIPQNKQKRLQLKYNLVEIYRSKQMMEQALETAMEIIKQDKNWADKKTNKFVLQIFKELGGNKSIVVQKYRKILQRLLS